MLRHLTSYKDGRVDGFFSDNSIVTIRGSHIDYDSSTGTKATIKSCDAASNMVLLQKLIHILKKHNKYSQTSLYTNNMIETQQEVVKSQKISQITWGSTIQNIKSAHRLYSLDRTAFVQVDSRLMLVKISYLQQISDSCLIQKEKNQKNITKTLLTKYNLEYQEYPQPAKTPTIGYKYIRQSKQYIINHVPQRWQYPVNLIWKQILNQTQNPNPIIEPSIFVKSKLTYLEKIKYIQQSEQIKTSGFGVPVFRFPRHSSNVNLMIDIGEDDSVGWINEGSAQCYDGVGFWILNYQSLHLKFSNSLESSKIYNVNAIPLVVRAENNYEKSIKDFLIAIYNASVHKPLPSIESQLSSLQSLTNTQTTEQSKQLQKLYHQYGVISIMTNHIVTGKFNDGLFIIANYLTHSVRVKDKDGNSLTTTTNDIFYSGYLEIMHSSYQNVYYPQQYQKKSRIIQQMQERISLNESVVERITSGDYLKKASGISGMQGIQTYDIDQVMRKNQDILKRLAKYS